MFGNPTETNVEMDETVKMIQRIQPQHQGFSTYCNYPGTPMADKARSDGILMDSWYSRSHYPWQRALKGTDYSYVQHLIELASHTPRRFTSPIRAGLIK